MDRLDAMRVFTNIVEEGSLSACARKLGMPLTTVSRKLNDLEAFLGAQLLKRTTRRIELTETGQSYFESSKKILEDLAEIENVAKGEFQLPRGHLVITAPVEFGRIHIMPLVAEFLKSYPDISITLDLTDRIVGLLEEHVDVAIRIGDLPDSNLITKKLGYIQKVTCASPSYLATRGTPVTLKELTAHDCISITSMGSTTSWQYFSDNTPVKIPIHPRLVVTTVHSGIASAVAGVGIVRALSYQVEQALLNEELECILQNFEPKPIPIHLVRHGSRIVPTKVRAFTDFAVSRAQQQLVKFKGFNEHEALK